MYSKILTQYKQKNQVKDMKTKTDFRHKLIILELSINREKTPKL
jgi:hypothetical protein